MDIKDQITEKLMETEKKYGVKIIYAAESGSRSWGFASPDSDYDCRFIYVSRLESYLSLEERKDTIECELNPVFDISGWDLKKALKLLKRSNAAICEWLLSPIKYKEEQSLIEPIRGLIPYCFDEARTLRHYMGVASGKLSAIREKETERLKTYFYCLRPLACCQHILEFSSFPPVEYASVIGSISIEPRILDEINKLLLLKASMKEGERIPKNASLLEYMDKAALSIEEELSRMHGNPTQQNGLLDGIFRKTIEDAWI
ncbi:MAG: nucleotidyltransferase domain-containing protein [Clostridiales bacterium]|jgi:predicted nucleotidyltransferase|nr:nucleotidyltransferase domain-containing protein [Clostridiales bacterium]